MCASVNIQDVLMIARERMNDKSTPKTEEFE